jgi:hypothetical protein
MPPLSRLLAQSGHPETLNQCPLLGVKRTSACRRLQTSPFLALPLGFHLGQRWVSAFLQSQLDAFDEQIMDFAPF